MTDAPLTPEEERSADAAEYVLRLLADDEEAALRLNALDDPAFRREIQAWVSRLAPLSDEVDPVDAPGRVWANIERHLFAASDGLERRLQGQVSVAPGLWRWSLTTALAAGVAYMAYLYAPNLQPPKFRFEITTPETAISPDLAFDVAVFAERREMEITPRAGQLAPGRSAELWLILGDAAPRSLGLLDPEAPTKVRWPKIPDLDQVVFAVSDEPQGGSPSGRPTGTVMATLRLPEPLK